MKEIDLSAGPIAKDALRKNAENATTWKHHELAGKLYGWTDIFRDRFLDGVAIPGEGRLPGPVIGFERTDVRVLAYYRLGKNAFGLEDEVILNEKHLDRPLYSILETCLHEQVHLWQQRKGKHPVDRNYHNVEFVDKCESLGLHPAPIKGFHIRPADGPFEALLREYGILKPDFEEVPDGDKRDYWTPPGKKKGRSTLSLWECDCEPPQKARVGKAEFFAECPVCRSPFHKKQ